MPRPSQCSRGRARTRAILAVLALAAPRPISRATYRLALEPKGASAGARLVARIATRIARGVGGPGGQPACHRPAADRPPYQWSRGGPSPVRTCLNRRDRWRAAWLLDDLNGIDPPSTCGSLRSVTTLRQRDRARGKRPYAWPPGLTRQSQRRRRCSLSTAPTKAHGRRSSGLTSTWAIDPRQ